VASNKETLDEILRGKCTEIIRVLRGICSVSIEINLEIQRAKLSLDAMVFALGGSGVWDYK
jgi:hypothetical protein